MADRIYAVLAAAGYNFRLFLRWFEVLIICRAVRGASCLVLEAGRSRPQVVIL